MAEEEDREMDTGWSLPAQHEVRHRAEAETSDWIAGLSIVPVQLTIVSSESLN